MSTAETLLAKATDGLTRWLPRLAIVFASLCLVACNRREGLNFDCRWVPDPVWQVDVRSQAHVQHLLDDIRVAEELGIRYGDRMAGTRLVETFGIVSRHGGTKNRDLGRQSRQQCVATLFGAITSTHGITVADIERMRPRLADRGFDLPVTIPVALLLAFAVRRFTGGSGIGSNLTSGPAGSSRRCSRRSSSPPSWCRSAVGGPLLWKSSGLGTSTSGTGRGLRACARTSSQCSASDSPRFGLAVASRHYGNVPNEMVDRIG